MTCLVSLQKYDIFKQVILRSKCFNEVLESDLVMGKYLFYGDDAKTIKMTKIDFRDFIIAYVEFFFGKKSFCWDFETKLFNNVKRNIQTQKGE